MARADAVTAGGHEIDHMRHSDMARQVRQKHDAAFEDAEQQQVVAAGVIRAELPPELGDTILQPRFVDEHFRQVLLIRRWHAVSRIHWAAAA